MSAVDTVPAAGRATKSHKTTAHSVVEPSRRSKWIAAVLVIQRSGDEILEVLDDAIRRRRL